MPRRLSSRRARRAHNLGESYLYLQIERDSVSGRFEIASDRSQPGLGLEGTPEEITPENFEQHVDFLQRYYRENVSIFRGAEELPFEFTDTR